MRSRRRAMIRAGRAGRSGDGVADSRSEWQAVSRSSPPGVQPRGRRDMRTTTSSPRPTASSRAHPRLEVDNCEISAFAHGGVSCSAPATGITSTITSFTTASTTASAMVSRTSDAASLIEYNLFNWNRHSIAGTGRPGLPLHGPAQRRVGRIAQPLLRHARRTRPERWDDDRRNAD